MMTSITPPPQLAHIYELLIAAYGQPQWIPDYDPLGGLIGTILSQHTSDRNSERAFQQLIATFPTWEEVRDADTEDIVEAIRCGGLASVKAPRIQAALESLTKQQQQAGGTLSLSDYLRDVLLTSSLEDGWHYLRSIPGVGPKTAACVLMFNMGLPMMPVDTHVHRVSQRLGLIGPKVSADQAHGIFAQMTPPAWVYPLHVHLIRHGRQVCHAQRPACETCFLFKVCLYVAASKSKR
jgi:endonuclease-3